MPNLKVLTVTRTGNNVVVTGTDLAGAKVEIKSGAVLKGSDTTDANGKWTISFTVLAGETVYMAFDDGGKGIPVTVPAAPIGGGGDSKGG